MVNFFWSRKVGKFVDKVTGADAPLQPKINCTVREWYETLIETMIDVQLSVLRGHGENHMKFVSWRADPTLFPIVECSVLYRPTIDKMVGMIGTPEGGGLIVNLPISPQAYLRGSNVFQLMQFEGSEVQRVLGAVEVLDAKISAQ